MKNKIRQIVKNKKTWAVLAILCLAFFIRINTFWIPHWQGDQSQYISLAMKLDTLGFSEYNLRGVNIQYFSPRGNTDICIISPILAKDINSAGVILTALEGAGGRKYNSPLFHLPPAFPFAIMISHKIFTEKNTPYLSIESNKKHVRASLFPKTQFYAVIIPLMCDLGVILCTFFIGRLLFNTRTGLYASFFLAVNAINILASQRIWSDTMLSFFVTLSALLFLIAFNNTKKQTLCFVLSGAFAAIAILCKQTAGFYVFAMLAFLIIVNEKWYALLFGSIFAFLLGSFITKDNFFGFLLNNTSFLLLFYAITYFRLKQEPDAFEIVNTKKSIDKRIFLFVVPIILITSFWFLSMYAQTGDPLHLPKQTANKFVLTKDIKLWNNILYERPQGRLLFFIGIPMIFPLFLLTYVTIKEFAHNLLRCVIKKSYDHRFIFLWLIILFFFYNLGNNREHRLMLPSYFAFAVLAGYLVEKFQNSSAKIFSSITLSRKIRSVIILTALTFCAIWSVKIGLQATLSNALLIKVPF